MIAAMAKAYQVLGEPRDLEAAERAARFILDRMVSEGRLLRTHKDGRSHVTAYLDDHAFLAAALVDLYEATFEASWLERAIALARRMVDLFGDDSGGPLFFTARDQDPVLARSRPLFDNAIPSGNSAAAAVLVRLAAFTGDRTLRDRAEAIVRAPGVLAAADDVAHGMKEVAVAGDRDDPDTEALVREVWRTYAPGKAVVLARPGLETIVPWIEGKERIGGRAAAYVCVEGTCQAPITDPSKIAEALRP
jgi:uncharacterized protein YyaL (SSP411 family)